MTQSTSGSFFAPARLPKYRKHRATGQAVVTLSGKDFYLGPHGTAASRREYDRRVCEWLENGRSLAKHSPLPEFTVKELCLRYWQHARGYYVKNGRRTATTGHIKALLRLVRRTYGDTPAVDFGPLALKVVRRKLIDTGYSRKYINSQIGNLTRMFRWASAEQLLPATIYQALRTVPGLKKGRSPAPDYAPVLPVPEDLFQQTLPHLSRIVADMCRLQRLTGCRPAEVCLIRPCDINRTEDVWEYRPESHKTEHHGRERVVYIGPKGQDILRPYLLRAADANCFDPREAEAERRAELHANRQTPLAYGNRPGTNRQRKPQRPPGPQYTTASYGRAIARACEKAFPVPDDLPDQERKTWRKTHSWAPNRLRHSTATEVRTRFGLEAAQTVLGHAAADVTQVYAERDQQLARNVMRQLG